MKNNNHYFFAILLLFSFASCEDFDGEIFPLVGTYEAHVQGVTGPFSMNISAERNDDVLIEAPFDGFDWAVIEADIDNVDDLLKDIDINRQTIADGVTIEGEGFYFDGSFQLDYTIDFNGVFTDFVMVGSKF